MNTKLVQWLGGVLLALLVAGGSVAWWRSTHVRVEKWVDEPRTGEARSNPLYALKLALQADGVRVATGSRLVIDASHPLDERGTLLLFNNPNVISDGEAQRLLDWVEHGGHLVLRMPPRASSTVTAIPLLSHLDIAPLKTTEGCTTWHAHGAVAGVEFCSGQRFRRLPSALVPVLQWDDQEKGDRGSVFVRLAHGKGSVDVLTDLNFLVSDALNQPMHIELARQILAPNYRTGTVYLIHDMQMPSFWGELLRRYWMAWGPLLLALIAWLWQRMQRFGPLLPAPASERRSLLEHIDASGRHIYRYGYADRLLGAVRHAFLMRLRYRDPQAAALSGDAQAAWLAERFGMPAVHIREALDAGGAHDHNTFRTRIALLIRLRNQL